MYSLAVDFDVLPASPSISLETVGAREAGGTGPGVIGVFTFGGGGLGGCVGRGVAARNELSVLRIACGRKGGGSEGYGRNEEEKIGNEYISSLMKNQL